MEKLATGSQQKASNGVQDYYLTDEVRQLISTLPREKDFDGTYLYQYQEGFWYRPTYIVGILSAQRHFQARDDDIILITYPKSGTTWLKALTYAIVHRSHYAFEHSPLLTANPHELVPFIDHPAYYSENHCPRNLEHLPNSTHSIFGTHIPYPSIPRSIMNSNCRIVYMCRNPLDQFISYWHFMVKIAQDRETEPLSLEEALERVSHGIQGFGPSWEHVLGYWRASLENPNKILFLKYEDVMEDTLFYVKKMAEFLGCPFSSVEENQGVIEEISKLCSFENMKDLEVNKTGRLVPPGAPKNSFFFREGKVGDWTNYLTSPMLECLKNLMEEKFSGSGLTFRIT
ncbi:hypothetical protein JRO89_XS06G0159300 [Xanthoceras sorbifolium]|uniref:Sulfotransferase n=1 Tax=Xanthoceras sorbifolium TaxID=99658 RepID=A0ABQ8HYM6_9ROSI|nr:hypothetical protein JRO89_XS06G0159300 [Xanthoceras sorbifolium]